MENKFSAINEDVYMVNFDGTEKCNWKNLVGEGVLELDEDCLKITRNTDVNNEFVFFDQNTPQLKDAEVEMVFRLYRDGAKGTGRFGFAIRPQNDGAYLFVGYIIGGRWYISTNKKGEEISFEGPNITAGESYKLQVRYEGKRITIYINDELIFDKEVDIPSMPLNSSYGLGFKTWRNETSPCIEYFRVGPIGSVIGKEVAKKDIKSIRDIIITTYNRVKPELPEKISVIYSDGTEARENVIWEHVPTENYFQIGEFNIYGTICNRKDRAEAKIIVEDIGKAPIGTIIVPEVTIEEKILHYEDLYVILDNNFPRVIRYEWKDKEVLYGENEQLYIVELNNIKYVPTVDFKQLNEKTASYTMTFKELDLDIKLNLSVIKNNVLRMEVIDINEKGSFVLRTIKFPDHSLASVRDIENGKLSGVLTVGDWNNIKEEFITVKDAPINRYKKTYGIINNDKFAITLNNNIIEGGDRISINVEDRVTYKKASLANGTWTYRESVNLEKVVSGEPEELPWSEVMIARDVNKDGKVDWQDAAILYRENMKETKGAEYIRNSFSYIPLNIASLVQSPFLRTADTIKKLYNYTDGFGQLVLEKGYQGEGHDDVIADIGGHTGIRQGGKEELNRLIEISKNYNAKIGIHVNVTEYHLDAFELKVENLVPGFKEGWLWKDKSYYVDQQKDITSGELARRFNMLKEEHPNLDWIYIDVYTGNGWNAKKLADIIQGHGWMVGTEFNGPLEQQTAWTHWGGDPSYPNRGNESKIIRFIRNQEQDVFMSSDLLKGAKHLLSGGWGSKHDIEGFYAIETFYNHILPSKYMQHFKIQQWEENEKTSFVRFDSELEVRREDNIINMYKDNKLIAATKCDTIDERGIGKTKLFIHWTWKQIKDTSEDKIYHWNPYGGETTWELPMDWGKVKTVKLYELSALGRTFVEEIEVIDGNVTIVAKENIPYVIFKEKVEEDRIDTWGEGTLIKDPGFDSKTLDNWIVETSGNDKNHIRIITENVEGRIGNDVVIIQGNGGEDAKISQQIKNLVPGKNYTASVWVKTDGDRKVTLGVDYEGESITSTIEKETRRINAGEGVKWLNDKMTRLRVKFSVPEGITTAKLYIFVEKDEKDSRVLIDDFRIWINPLEIEQINRDGYVLYEDFENVDEGYGPFYMGENLKKDTRTHFVEKNPKGSQYMNWVIDGRFSLKTNQQSEFVGEILVTDESTLKLKPNTVYELGLSYTNKLKDVYSVTIKSPKLGELFNEILNPGRVLGKPEDGANYSREIKEFKYQFRTGLAEDYYFAIEKNEGFDELVIDNVYIKEVTS